MTADLELVRRIAAGDEDAFAAFYRAHLDAVVAFFHRRVPEPELAFDLAAETFAAVAVGARSYQGDGPAVGWLYGIARNKLRDAAACARARAERLAALVRGRPPAVRQAAARELARIGKAAREGQTLYVVARAAGSRSSGGVGIPVHPGQPLRPGLAMFGGGLYLGIAEPRTVRIVVRARHRPAGLPRRLEVAQGFWAAVLPHGTGRVSLLEEAADGTVVNRVNLRG